MSDVLIRDVPEDVIAAIDRRATTLGLSRHEYLRRQLRQDAQRQRLSVEVADLQQFEVRFGDLTDSEVMARAWS